jgi:TolA-binding protein
MREASTATAEATAALETFVETATDALASLGADEATLSNVEAAGDELITAVTAHQNRVEHLEDRVETLESELKTERETRAKEAAEDRKRLSDLETRVDDDTETVDSQPDVETPSDASTPGVEPPQTPLEDVVRVPEHLVEESLTANQQRARFIAKDAHEYTQQVPAGRAIKSSALRRVLAAGEDATIYTETVSRVIDFLDDLGQDAVKIRESQQGERVVVFTDAFVKRVVAYQNHRQRNTVVTEGGVTG